MLIAEEHLAEPYVHLQKKYDDLARQTAAECEVVKQQWQQSRVANHRAGTCHHRHHLYDAFGLLLASDYLSCSLLTY